MENVVSIHAKSELIGPVKTEITIRDFHSFHIDEPQEFGGSNSKHGRHS